MNIDQPVRARAGRIAAILLAAGRATRFGAPKLLAPLGGRPLIDHVARTVADMPFAYRLCVTTQEGADLAPFGFDMIIVEQGLPQSRSLAAGIAAAAALDIDAVMVLLGDMPLVSRTHLAALITAFDGDIIASSQAGTAMPPAIFGRQHFARLTALTGDTGARDLLKRAPRIEAPAGQLLDIDTPADLLAAEALGGRAKG